MAYEPVREADIAWEKRIWDRETQEKMNLPWRAEEAPFFNILKDMIQNGTSPFWRRKNLRMPWPTKM